MMFSFRAMMLIVEMALSLHFFARCRVAFGGGWWQFALILWLAFMMIPQSGFVPEEVLGFLKMDLMQPVWLGGLLLFFLASVGLDVLRLAAGLAGALSGRSCWSLLAAGRAVPLALLLTLAVMVHSYYTAHHPRLSRLTVRTDKLPEDVDSILIAHLSDVHLSGLIGQAELKRMLDPIIAAEPDILAVTGDLVDGDMLGRDAEAALLASVKPRYGAYAVLGNHENHRGLDNSLKFMEKAGLRVLRGEGLEAGGIVVAGMDDESIRNGLAEPAKFLQAWRDSGLFVLLLKHRPRPAPGSPGFYDLQLSGHTHGGQIWPGHYMIRRVNGYLHGLYSNPETESLIYVTRGGGFWGIPLRFLAPPEVTLIELTRATALDPPGCFASSP